MAAISMAFAVPVILDELERRTGRRALRAVVAAVLGASLTTVIIRNRNDSAVRAYEEIRDNVPAVVGLLALGLALVATTRLVRRSDVRAATACAFFVLVAAIALMPARYIGIGQTGESPRTAEASCGATRLRTTWRS